MYRLALIENGKVKNIILAKKVGDWHGYVNVTAKKCGMGWIDNGDGTYSEPAAEANPRLEAVDVFLRKIPRGRLGQIVKQAETNDDLRGMLYILNSKPEIDLSSQELIDDLESLRVSGVITQQEKDKLLS